MHSDRDPLPFRPRRLQALVNSGLLSGQTDVAFDRLTRLAARLLAAPAALLTLTDQDRVVVKSAFGLSAAGSGSSLQPSRSLCPDVVSRNAPVGVADVRREVPAERAQALLELGYVAYLGVPFHAPDGKCLGSFCVLDTGARPWKAEEVEWLSDLARSVELEVATRYYERHQAETEKRLRETFENAAVGIAYRDLTGRWLGVNRTLAEIVGYSREELLERTFQELTHPDDLEPDLENIRRVLAGEIADYTMEKRYIRKNGTPVWIELTASPIRNDAGEIELFIAIIRDISYRKITESKLVEAEARFRQLAETVQEVYWIYDAGAGRFEYVSPAASVIWGFAPEQILADSNCLLGAIHPEDREDYRALRSEGLGPASTWADYRVVGPGDAVRHVRERAYPVRDAKETRRFAGTTVDITEARRAEEAVRQSEQELRRVIDALFAFVGVMLPDGTLIEANRRALDAAALKPEDVLGKPFDETYWWTHSPGAQARLRRAIENAARGIPSRYDEDVRVAGGEIITIDFALVPVLDESGAVIRLVPSGVDITERKRVVRALEENEERLRALYEWAAQGILSVSAGGEILAANRMVEKLFGYSREELAGRKVELLVPEGLREVHAAHRNAYLANPRSRPMGHQLDLMGQRKDGSRFPVEVALSYITTAQGFEISAFITDITQRKQFEEALERAIEERTSELTEAHRLLDARNRELQSFNSAASHDLRAPLRKIMTFCDQIMTATALGAREKDLLDRTRNAALRMSKLIDSLLSLSNVESRAQEFVHTDLAACVRDAINTLEISIQESGAEVIVGQLPSIRADGQQMEQLFQNLLGNALKFRRPGVPPRVEIRGAIVSDTATGQPLCRIEVQDNGIGFEPSHAERIFSPFHRLHSNNRYDGVGMGLTICRRIVDRHGGSISAIGAPGEGATFVINLPAANGHTQARTTYRT